LAYGLAYVPVRGMALGRGPDATFADDKLASQRIISSLFICRHQSVNGRQP